LTASASNGSPLWKVIPRQQLELPHGGGRDPIRLREQRHQLQILIPLEQPIEDVGQDVRRGRFLMVLRIERGRVDALRDDHRRRRGRGGAEHRDESEHDRDDAVSGHGQSSTRESKEAESLVASTRLRQRDVGRGR
jgi:hypothetical protein